MKDIRERIKSEIMLFDGGYGTLLQRRGLQPGEKPETWNITHPDVITALHREYVVAGAEIIKTNTFGANRLKFGDSLSEVIASAVNCARTASAGKAYVALDIGPTGKLIEPLGDLAFEDAVELFAEVVRIGVKCGVDLILIETFTDSYETKAATLASKENSDLPVFVTNAYGDDGKLMTGASPSAMVALLEGLGVDALGINCSQGPDQMLPVVRELVKNASVPVIVNPNAGLPTYANGETVFDVSAEEFGKAMRSIASAGATILGGCCGTSPEYVARLKRVVSRRKFRAIRKKEITVVSSYSRAAVFGRRPLLIGERINPTGKPKFKQALKDGDLEYSQREAVSQQSAGADILDVNVGLPDVNEVEMLSATVKSVQSVTDLPLQIDTTNVTALERALRLYNGKAMINSVNGKREVIDAVFPLVKKYGGVVVALTLDENGIPSTSAGRFAIAQRILKEAEKYGISKKDIVFDALTMAVSAQPSAAQITLDTVSKITKKLRANTVLGVSNVSFGLPNRQMMNSAFLIQAITLGLSSAIINPFSADVMKAYYASVALCGKDENFASYVDRAPAFSESASVAGERAQSGKAEGLEGAIIHGLSGDAVAETEKLLASESRLDIINNRIIPALNAVGKGFEEKTIYLPSLLTSAEAAKAAFGVIKSRSAVTAEKTKGTIVLATVKGDVHDIGKNIVKLLLESHGYAVRDLGRDVPADAVVEAVKETGASLVGLSALMTTTVPSMEETVKLLHSECKGVKTVVGGAVLTRETAERIGADRYAPSAIDTVKFAEEVYGEK